MDQAQAKYVRNTPSLRRDGSAGPAKKLSLWARMRRHLARRPDSEHETAFNRFALTACVSFYLIGASLFGDADAHHALMAFAIFYAIFNLCAIILFCSILLDLKVSPLRRSIAIFIDIGFLSYLIHVGDSATALLYPLNLWIIFGNGFRFGTRYLAIATAVSAAAFSTVVVTTPFWRDNISLSLGLLVGQIILPAYVSILIRKLSEAKRQAEEGNRSKSLFLASVTHELRTPLNAIIGFSDLLSEMTEDEEQVDMLRTIAMAGRSLLNLINSILDLSQNESKRTPDRVEDIDLFALLATTRDMLAIQAHPRGLWLTLHITPRTPQFILSDRRSFEEILVNLTGNALKFTTKGHVAIFADAVEADAEKIKLRIEVSDTGIGIAPDAQKRIFDVFTQADATIIDRFGGSGLGLAIVKQVVEAKGGEIGVESMLGRGSTFWLEFDCKLGKAPTCQLLPEPTPWLLLSDDGEARSFMQSLGADVERLPLSADLLKRITQLKKEKPHYRPVVILDEWSLGKDLEVFARQLRGDDPGHAPILVVLKENSSIEIPARELYLSVLPRPLDELSVKNIWLHVSWNERKKMQRLAEAEAKTVSTTSLSILVAEDNKTNQKVIAKILERAGHSVVLADNGEVALEKLIDNHFDLALVDLNMPVLNGIEMTKLYRFVAVDRPHLPIIALTADATADAKARCAEAGMDDCLTKPIEPDHLLKVLNTFAGVLPRVTTAVALSKKSLAARAATQPAEPLEVESGDAIDSNTLTYLQKLGGKDFVADIVDQYVSDAARMLRELSDAVAEENLPMFQDRVHALRSCSANVGAKAIYNLCLSWREVDAYDLALRGEDHMKMLEAEFAKAQSALVLYDKD
jgi:two-component system sensor histidine kinase RpfC